MLFKPSKTAGNRETTAAFRRQIYLYRTANNRGLNRISLKGVNRRFRVSPSFQTSRAQLYMGW